MAIILEPCCKQTQFNQILHTLRKDSTNSRATIEFIHYGDVTFPDWFTFLILEAKGADATFTFRTLDLTTLNYILNRMRDHAFIPGKNLHLLNHVTITAKNIPDPLPLRAETLQAEGRLTIKTTKHKTKIETITLTPPSTSPTSSPSSSPSSPADDGLPVITSSSPTSPADDGLPVITSPSSPSTPKYILPGKIFADKPNAPRTILITQFPTPNS